MGLNDIVVFARGLGGLWQVAAAGGEPKQITKLDESKHEVSHRLPHLLPGDDAVLFTVTQNEFPNGKEPYVWVQSLRTGERKRLCRVLTHAT